jgi:small-conductance mechanosensitive channel
VNEKELIQFVGPPLAELSSDRSSSALFLLLVALGFLMIVRRVRRATGSQPQPWVRPAQLAAWAIMALTIVFLIGRLLPETWRPAGLLILLALLVGGLSFLKNVLAGVALLLERRIEVGDMIQVDGISGEVEVWGLRSVRIRTIDGTVHDIPNEQLLSRPVTNFTDASADAACEIEIALSVGSDAFEAQEVARTAAAVSMYASPRRRPDVFLSQTINGEIRMRVRGYAFDAVHRDHFESDVRIRILEALGRSEAASAPTSTLVVGPTLES